MANQTIRIRPGLNKGVLVGVGGVTSDLPVVVERSGASRVALLSTPSGHR